MPRKASSGHPPLFTSSTLRDIFEAVRSGAIPLRFDLADLLSRARRQVSSHVGDVTLNLPFISIDVSPSNRERQVAQEVVIRLKDRRVLSAWECCDSCINHALASLQEIRRTLQDKQVELAGVQDGPLYLVVEAMLSGIRQFLTYEELLSRPDDRPHPRFGEFHRPEDTRQAYFDALEILRGHLSRCLGQIAKVAGMEAPVEGLIANYQGPWPMDAYVDISAPIPASSRSSKSTAPKKIQG